MSVNMKLVKQAKQIIIRNIDESSQSKDKTVVQKTLLPNSIRAVIVGPSNCGKTNLMINLIESPNGLRFKNIYVHSKSLYQQKYCYLRKLIKPIKEINLFTFSKNEEVLSPAKACPHSIIIFADVIWEKQNSMERHKFIDCFHHIHHIRIFQNI